MPPTTAYADCRRLRSSRKFEFDYARTRLGVAKLIPVVMDPTMRSTAEWYGAVGMSLSAMLYIDLSEAELRHSAVGDAVRPLVSAIREAANGVSTGEARETQASAPDAPTDLGLSVELRGSGAPAPGARPRVQI